MDEVILYENKPIGTIAYMGGIPYVPEQFCWSWSQMVQYNTEFLCLPGENIHYDRATVSYHAFARNSIVKRMEGEWLLMLDTDHVFDPDLAVRLLHRMSMHDLDVVAGMYQYKVPPYAPVMFQWSDEKGYQVIGKWDKDIGLFQIHSAGAGCLLVRKRVFDKIASELKEEPFDIAPPYSEDHSFFNRLKKLGIKAFCDPRIQCHHLTQKAISLDDFDATDGVFCEPMMVEGIR